MSFFTNHRNSYDPGDENLEIHQQGVHRGSYHRFFEDYEERTIIDSKGRQRIERTYIGNYYRLRGKEREWKLRKALYPLLLILSFSLFVWAAYPNYGCNRVWYETAVQAVCMAAYFRLFWIMFTCVTSPRNMTIFEYREGRVSLEKTALFQVIALSCCTLGVVIYCLITQNFRTSIEGSCMLLFVLSACCVLWIFYREKTAVYDVTENEKELSEDAVRIRK